MIGQANRMKEISKWLMIATSVMNDLFLAFTVSGSPSMEESCTYTHAYLESL